MDTSANATVNSPVAVRSNRGCWTCRLRKKKCDEERPGCRRCAGVNVQCHYGARPKWINDAKAGKEELERIKAIVAASASKKRAAHRASKRPRSASQSPTFQSAKSPKILKKETPDTVESAPPPRAPVEVAHDETTKSTSLLFPKWIEDQEASLMMHYLDHVFFIQFRFHTPSLSSGRGWLLSLLTRNKPLYHAALSLSAFHRQSLLLEQESDPADVDYLHELQHHHDLALKELQHFIHTHNKSDSEQDQFDGNIQILALLHGVSNGSIPGPEIILDSSQFLHYSQERSPKLSNSCVSRDSAALDFFTGAIIWMDALACVSTGSHPYLSEFHNQLLSAKKRGSSKDDHKIQLYSIMGCDNWVMIMISEIAWLSTWRKKHDGDRSLDFQEQLHTTENNIRTRLESSNAEVLEELNSLRSTYGGAPPHYSKAYSRHTILLVTHIFACASLIYLKMATSSSLAPEHVDLLLHNTINAMQKVPNPQMFRGLVWPLSVAGCLASSPQNQEFFRNSASAAVRDSNSFGNSGTALQILEKSWELQRRDGRLIDCTATIYQLGTCVLLV
ncbi:hypothetical protein CJF32_00001845 [Rutstroemia sp. NJR-2017a WRK4]|nr:hypothetical protein CJF32_00001845 [Rutstroemia sp. NJR-2017a WRK4]